MDRIVVMTGWPLTDSEGCGYAGCVPGPRAALRRERRVDAWSAADAVDFTAQGAGVRIRVGHHSAGSCERPREFARNDILGNHGGNNLIVNTRSALSLMRANIPQAAWNLMNATETQSARISVRLVNNNLTIQGIDVIQIHGGPPHTSFLK
jgi:hypothetical protein